MSPKTNQIYGQVMFENHLFIAVAKTTGLSDFKYPVDAMSELFNWKAI